MSSIKYSEIDRDRIIEEFFESLRRNTSASGYCHYCLKKLEGRGSNNAVYCFDCWKGFIALFLEGSPAELIVLYEAQDISVKAFYRKVYKLRRRARENNISNMSKFLERRYDSPMYIGRQRRK